MLEVLTKRHLDLRNNRINVGVEFFAVIDHSVPFPHKRAILGLLELMRTLFQDTLRCFNKLEEFERYRDPPVTAGLTSVSNSSTWWVVFDRSVPFPTKIAIPTSI